MSFAEGFSVPTGMVRTGSNAAASVCASDAPQTTETVVSDDESDAESTDSMASSPLTGPSRYKRTFKSIVRGVFKVVHTEDGLDHADFKQRVAGLKAELGDRAPGARVEEDVLFLHVICNQYAAATGLESGDVWEKWTDMCHYYASGLLPLYTPQSASKRKRAKWNFGLAAGLVEREEEAYTTRKFLESHGLAGHEMLHWRMEAAAVAWLRKRNIPEPPTLPPKPFDGVRMGEYFAEHAFAEPDAKHFEALLPEVMKEQLREDAGRLATRAAPAVSAPAMLAPTVSAPARSGAPGTAPRASVVAAPARPGAAAVVPAAVPATVPATVPRGGAAAHGRGTPFYTPTHEDLERDPDFDPQERVTWNANVLQKMRVYELINESPNMSRILSSFSRCLSVDDAVMQVAMKCGAHYIRKPQSFQPQPVMNEENRRVYTRAMLPAMFACANEVVAATVLRFN